MPDRTITTSFRSDAITGEWWLWLRSLSIPRCSPGRETAIYLRLVGPDDDPHDAAMPQKKARGAAP